jgi:hypothetical protein
LIIINGRRTKENIIYNKGVVAMKNYTSIWLTIILSCVIYSCGKSNSYYAIQEKMNEENRLWMKKSIQNYSYEFKLIGLSIDNGRMRKIVVNNNQVVSVLDLGTNELLDPAFITSFNTIDGLYNEIQNAITNKYERIDVSYNEVLNYPTKISFDISLQANDDEVTYYVDKMIILEN